MQKKSNGQISAKNDRRMPNNWGSMKGFFRLLLGYLSFSLKKMLTKLPWLFPISSSTSPMPIFFHVSIPLLLLVLYFQYPLSPIYYIHIYFGYFHQFDGQFTFLRGVDPVIFGFASITSAQYSILVIYIDEIQEKRVIERRYKSLFLEIRQ